ERHDESVRWNFLDRGTGFRKMDRCIQMRAGMFDEPPPIKIEAVFRKIEFLLHLDSRHAEKGRKISRHGMSEIDDRGEAARGGCAGHVRRSCRGNKRGGKCPAEEASSRQCMPHRFLTSGNTHAKPPSIGRRHRHRATLTLAAMMRNPALARRGNRMPV